MHVHRVGGPVNVRISLEPLTIAEGHCPGGLEERRQRRKAWGRTRVNQGM